MAHLSVGVGQLWHLMALLLEAADQIYVLTDHTSVVVAAFYNLMDHIQADEYLIASIKVKQSAHTHYAKSDCLICILIN